MQFFIPGTASGNADYFYQGIREFVAGSYGFETTPRRIFSVRYEEKGEPREVTVGRQLVGGHETVYAILETDGGFLACTPQRGVSGARPLAIPAKAVVEVLEFDAEPGALASESAAKSSGSATA